MAGKFAIQESLRGIIKLSRPKQKEQIEFKDTFATICVGTLQDRLTQTKEQLTKVETRL